MLVSKTDYRVCDTFYETHVEQVADGEYILRQSNALCGPVDGANETVFMNREQAVHIAKTILRNEGYDIE